LRAILSVYYIYEIDVLQRGSSKRKHRVAVVIRYREIAFVYDVHSYENVGSCDVAFSHTDAGNHHVVGQRNIY
jgi:hypothetical protein